MSLDIPLGKVPIIRFQGIFDFDKLYKLMVKWFSDRNFSFYEPVYKDKPATLGREIEIEWQTDRKLTPFWEEHIDVKFHLWDMLPVEVIQEGEKKMLTKARIEISLIGKLVGDYQERWTKSDFMQGLLKFYFEHIIVRKWAGTFWDPSYYRIYQLHTFIKDILNLETKKTAPGR